jgi:hypothetical protein
MDPSMSVVAKTRERGDGPGLDATPSLRKARANATIARINSVILILFGDDQGNSHGCLSPNSDALSGLIGWLRKSFNKTSP